MNLLPLDANAGGGPPCQEPIVSRYCSSTQIDLLTPQQGRAKVFLSQILKIYRPKILLGQIEWPKENEDIEEVTLFHDKYDIQNIARDELRYLEGEKQEDKFLNGTFFSTAQCYAGGNFTNLARYYQGLEQSGLERETIRYLALLRLLLIQDCMLDTDVYIDSTKTKERFQDLKNGLARGWLGYIEAVAFYHDGFYPEAADLFATIAREEKEAEQATGWLVETARYMEVLSLFHKGREGQGEVFLPTIFNSFTEAFVSDFPRSEYRKHIEDMSAGIWLHYNERERYYQELITKLDGSHIFNDRTAGLDHLDELTVNALFANIADIAEYPIEHQNGYTLLPAILSKAGDVSDLCAQRNDLSITTPAELNNYIEMSCGYLLGGTALDVSAFTGTPLFIHAKAFEAQTFILAGKMEEQGNVFSQIAFSPELSLKDLFGLRSLQVEARLKQKRPKAFILNDKITGSNKPASLSIMDAVLYEQISRYFLSATQLDESLAGEKQQLLKFSLIRPHLDEAMIQENWKAAEAFSSIVEWDALLASKALTVSGKLSIEISNYSKIAESLSILAKGGEAPEALADVAYFLYENHVAPRCGYERPRLIDDHLAVCDSGYLAPSEKGMVRVETRPVKEIRAPIEMLSEALDIYKRRDGFEVEEARLLRIMVYCAKGGKNVSYCLRWKNIPKAKFKGWFEDLNLNYPRKEHIQYWFYDLPYFSNSSEEEADNVEQQYWYDEDAYLGYLDGTPYELDSN